MSSNIRQRACELTKKDFEQLSELHYRIRQFERFSGKEAQQGGITPLQHLLLLHLKGFPGREWATVGELAERLRAQHHSVVALVSRCEALELVIRKVSEKDRRQVEVHLLQAGEWALLRLAEIHQAQLTSIGRLWCGFGQSRARILREGTQ